IPGVCSARTRATMRLISRQHVARQQFSRGQANLIVLRVAGRRLIEIDFVRLHDGRPSADAGRRRGGPAGRIGGIDLERPSARVVRCAVYTRKSTQEGLDREFSSLDAQREAAQAYIQSQRHEGWICLPDSYDDGGFTGGNLDRPALTRLLADIQAGRIDCVVVQRVDRLSRSLLDFAKLMETFEEHQVSFVSVTQQLNTATSMGRLVLNVLLSFAQFEREMIAERTRDKIAATRRKGKGCGGLPRVGCDVEPGRP